MIRTIAYDIEKRLYDIRYHTDLVRILFAGCTGKERDVATLFVSKSWGIEADARRQVAEGMRLSSQQDDTPTLAMLLGDQVYDDGVPVGRENLTKALAMLEEDVFEPYQSINADFFLGVGNHEASAHGKKQKAQQHLDEKTQAYVFAVQQANKPRFYMPANYYAQIVRNKQDEVLACIIYADTNSLPYDRVQQQWLLDTVHEFEAVGDAPWIWAGHHSFLDSVDSRGLKGDGGKYSAPKKLHNANQHQLIYATLREIEFPINRISSVFAAHVHTNYAKINVESKHLPMTELVFGGGGSWSNTTTQSTLAQGIVWSACRFGHGEVLLKPESMTASFKDCSQVKIAAPAKTQIDTSFEIRINHRSKTVDVIKNNGLSPVLLKKFKKHFSIVNQATQASSHACFLKIVCHLWAHTYQELQQLSQDLEACKVTENPVATLLLLPMVTEQAEVSPQDFLHTLEQCLWLLSTPINRPENQDMQFLGIKAYKALFTTLQVYHYCLRPRLPTALEEEDMGESARETNESQRETVDLPLERFKYENRAFLHDDSDDDGESGVNEYEDNENTPVAPLDVNILCEKSLTAGRLHGTQKLQSELANFLRSFMADSALLRKMITMAAQQRLDHLYTQYNQSHRKCLHDRDLFYFMGREDTEVARAYVVDFFRNRLPPEVLIKAAIATDADYTADFSGMMFQHLANAFVYKLQRHIDQNTDKARYAEAIFESWRAKHEDVCDEFEKDDCLRQRACALLGDYFVSLQLQPSDRVYAELLNNKPCLQVLWSEDKIWGPLFQAHFKVDQAKMAAYEVWRAQATPTFIQYWWASVFGGNATEIPSATALATNPLHL